MSQGDNDVRSESTVSNSIYNHSRRRFLTISSTAGLLSIAGCLGGDEDDETSTEVDPDSEPEKPDSITMRAWGGNWQESIENSIAETFTEETGIEVRYDNTNFQVIQNQVMEAIDQDREPPVNVVWTQSLMGFSAFQQGYTQNLNPDLIPAYENMIGPQIPDEHIPDNDHIPYVAMYGYTYPINYNSDQLEQNDQELPESWSDWWDSQYENSIGLYENATGLFRPLAHVADVDLRPDMDQDEMEPMWEMLEELSPNVGLVGSDPPLTTGLTDGEISLTHFLPNNIANQKDEGEPVDWYLPPEGSTYQTDGFYVPGGQNESEAYWSQVFMNYAMRDDVQQEWFRQLQSPMLNQNTSVPEEISWMADDSAFPTTQEQIEDLWHIDPMTYARHRQYMVSRFNEIIGT
ncbi:PotD/PotF family extracellular solute-binding protein [Natrarchaeobius sp. A-rgal3]|uniref:ABC transporter substrate-binding protein n=1 Tax=Natrarchaeobius versutus TaxID=1679078 RepID=UPI00351017E0